MREYVAALAATAALLGVSLAFADQKKAPAYKYHKDALVYAELAKAPQKALQNVANTHQYITNNTNRIYLYY